MIRIHPNIKTISPKFSHYDVMLHYRSKQYDLTKYYYNLDIHSLEINQDGSNLRTPKPIRKNLTNYLNYKEKEQHNCFHFARSIVNSSKYNVKSLPTSQLVYLKLFDKIGLIKADFNGEVYINHEAIYVGKHYYQHIFMSKLGRLGIYFMTLDQLSKLYDSSRFSIIVYTATNLLTHDNKKYDDNIRRDHRQDNLR